MNKKPAKENIVNTDNSTTISALRDKNILLTGASGFIGKVVLEKILRTIPGNAKIFLLLRPDKNYPTARQRLDQGILTSSLFHTLKHESESQFNDQVNNRVQVVEGQLTSNRFGMGDAEFKKLAASLDIIIHTAASVNFTEPLDQALAVNTLALNNFVELSNMAGNCPMVHVSSCYVHGIKSGECKEQNVLPLHKPGPDVLTQTQAGYFEIEPLIDKMQEKIKAIRQNLPKEKQTSALVDLGIEQAKKYGWNDTYTFTKWLGEQLLLKGFRNSWQLTIIRPSIVESTLADPVPGWIEGVKVADALILAYARRKFFLFPGNKKACLDIIPVDLAANAVLLGAAQALTAPQAIRVYQCASSKENPIPLFLFIRILQDKARTNYKELDRIFDKKPRLPFTMIPQKLFMPILHAAYHLEKIKYLFKRAIGVKASRKQLSNYRTTLNLAAIFSFYTSQNFIFSNKQLAALSHKMGTTDKKLFPVVASQINWHTYLADIHLAGLNRYAIKPIKKRPGPTQDPGA